MIKKGNKPKGFGKVKAINKSIKVWDENLKTTNNSIETLELPDGKVIKGISKEVNTVNGQVFGVWRVLNDIPIPCNYVASISSKDNNDFFFDINHYLELCYKNTGVNDGYYFANHSTQRGGYLFTDDHEQMLSELRKRNLIY